MDSPLIVFSLTFLQGILYSLTYRITRSRIFWRSPINLRSIFLPFERKIEKSYSEWIDSRSNLSSYIRIHSLSLEFFIVWIHTLYFSINTNCNRLLIFKSKSQRDRCKVHELSVYTDHWYGMTCHVYFLIQQKKKKGLSFKKTCHD